MRATAWLVVWVVGAALACTSSSGSGPSNGDPCTPGSTQICMTNFAFSPAVDTVALGATIQWANQDNVAHTATSRTIPASASAWDETVQGGGGASVTLTVAGTYEYYCRFHGTPGTGMHGTIVVR
jgi:plastocyanin